MQRFWDKVKKTDGCWEWTAGKTKSGYGRFKINGKTHRAHRISYQFKNGSLEEGQLVLHKCDNPLCVNPEHLFVGDNLTNTKDMIKKGRSKFSGRPRKSTFPKEIVDSAILELCKTHKVRELALQFGIGETTIYRIINRNK